MGDRFDILNVGDQFNSKIIVSWLFWFFVRRIIAMVIGLSIGGIGFSLYMCYQRRKKVKIDEITVDSEKEAFLDSDNEKHHTVIELQTQDAPKKNVGFVKKRIRFVNKSGRVVSIWYTRDVRNGDINYGKLRHNESKAFDSFLHHTWIMRDSETSEPIETFTINDIDAEYIIRNPKYTRRKRQRLQEEEREFRKTYKAETGRDWLSVYPRDPVKLFMYEPKRVGEVFHPSTGSGRKFEIKTQSLQPRVFTIDKLLSREECQHIINLARPKLEPSLVSTKGIRSDRLRISSNTFLKRSDSAVLDNIYDRLAAVLGLNHDVMRHDEAAEQLQVVHYEPGGYYNLHHDYLEPLLYKDSANIRRGNNRLLTLLLQLEAPEDGGLTHFEKPNLNFPTVPGNGILFYSMLPDGNLDVDSLHCGTEVLRGSKWIANLWIWDPRWT